MDVDVRAARPEELGAVLDLWGRAGSAPGVTDDIASLRRLAGAQPEAVLVAVVDGRLVGTLIVTWDGWRSNLYRLAVLPELRRRGIANRLLTEAERALRDAGARRVTALVVGGHTDAVGFWTGVGYAHDTRVRRYVRDLY